jgi:hypothetical protein
MRLRYEDWQDKHALALTALPLEQVFAKFDLDIGPRRTNCPFCDPKTKGRGKFKISDTGKSFGCYRTSCSASREGDWDGRDTNAIGLYQYHYGIDRREASLRWFLDSGAIDHETFEANLTPKAPEKAKVSAPKKEPAQPKTPETTDEPAPDPLLDAGIDEDDQIPDITPAPATAVAPKPTAAPAPHRPAPKPSGLYAPWAELHASMKLLQSDREMLRTERGITDEFIDLIGFKSSPKSNRELIENLRTNYTDEWLLNLGILKMPKSAGEPIANALLTGLGPDGCYEDGGRKRSFTNPLLIPYHDDRNSPFYMQPHKDCLTPSKVYKRNGFSGIYNSLFGFPIFEHFNRPRTIVISEGELKCAAAATCGICTLACPGISFIQNEAFRTRLIDFIRTHYIKEVIIVWDNDDRSHKPRDQRYDVQIYQLVMAEVIYENCACKVRVGTLPASLRDDNGGADWDSILTALIREHGESDGRKRATDIFQKVLQDAVPPLRTLELFTDRGSDRSFINSQVSRRSHKFKRNIKIGGDDERNLAGRIRYYAPDLAALYNSSYKCFYTLRPAKYSEAREKKITEAKSTLSEMMANPEDFSAIVRQANLLESLETRSLGTPNVCSNFSLEGQYRINRLNNQGIARIIKAYIPAERRSVSTATLTASDISRPVQFKEWCANNLGATYTGGDQVGLISSDLDAETAFRDISELDIYGYDKGSKLFNFGTSSYELDGTEIIPDCDNIIWSKTGYQIEADKSKVGDSYGHGAPACWERNPGRWSNKTDRSPNS